MDKRKTSTKQKRAVGLYKALLRDLNHKSMTRGNIAINETENSNMKKIMSEVREICNNAQVKRIFRMGSEIFTVIAPTLKNPTPWSIVGATLGVGRIIVDDIEIWSDDFFHSPDWTQLYSQDFSGIIINALSNSRFQTLKTADENYVIKIIMLNDIKIGYIMNVKNNSFENLYVETNKIKKAKETIKKLLWDQYRDKNLVIRLRRSKIGMENSNVGSVVFEQDTTFSSMTSSRAIEYSKYLKKHIDAGIPRSVMLYGPPGTGKSTMARTIIDNLNLRSFRIRVSDVSEFESSTLFEAINIFEPDAIILDDFDRSANQVILLETLEFFQKHIKLVMATVNDRNSLDEAILRPGRIDELVLIDQMDEDVVRSVLGPDLLDSFDVVKDWPIAFIQEFVKRRKFMNIEEATASTKELVLRVERLHKYDEDPSDLKKMLGLIKPQPSFQPRARVIPRKKRI